MFPFNVTQEDLLLLKFIKYEAQKQAMAMLYPGIIPQQTPPQVLLPGIGLLGSTSTGLSLTSERADNESLTVSNTRGLLESSILAENSKKRKHSKCLTEEDVKRNAHLCLMQKEKKSQREKIRRQVVSELYSELTAIITSLNLLQKSSSKPQRIDILNSTVQLMVSGEKLSSYKEELSTHKVALPQEGITKKKLKSINEKRRRDKLRFILNTLSEVVGLKEAADQGDILQAVLSKLKHNK